jgi:hypothetical protein
MIFFSNCDKAARILLRPRLCGPSFSVSLASFDRNFVLERPFQTVTISQFPNEVRRDEFAKQVHNKNRSPSEESF